MTVKRYSIILAMGLLFVPAAKADFLSISSCRALAELRCDEFLRVDPMFLDDCMMRGSSPPNRCKSRRGLRTGAAAPTYFSGVRPPQEPIGAPGGRGGGSGGGGIWDVLGGLIQGLPIAIPPSLPDLFGGGSGGSGGGSGGTGSGPGGSGGGGTGGGHLAEDTARCGLYGDTSEIPQVTGAYEMPCGGAVELSQESFTFDTNVQFVGHVEANKSKLNLYKRSAAAGVTGGYTFVFDRAIPFPSYYCKGGSVYSETVSLRPVEQFFAIGDSTTALPIRLFPDENPDTHVPTNPVTGAADPSGASGAFNYDYLNEFILIERSGSNFTPIGNDCDTRANLLKPMPANVGGITVTTNESSIASCSVQTLPMVGSCQPDVMWVNQDDSSFLVQPGTQLKFHDIQGIDNVVVEVPENALTYLSDGAYAFVPWGSGLQSFAEGAEITYNNDYYIYITAPGQFEVKSNGGIVLPNGGALYNSADDTLAQEYAPGTSIAKGQDSAYRVRPIGSIALPGGMMAVSKTGGSIRLPEDK